MRVDVVNNMESSRRRNVYERPEMNNARKVFFYRSSNIAISVLSAESASLGASRRIVEL